MNAKTELLQARDDMLAVLDDKLKQVPEWRAFRAIESALAVIGAITPGSNRASAPTRRPRKRRVRLGSYGDLALAAVKAANRPLPTDEVVTFIAAQRRLGADPRKARINIQSGLSRDERIRSIPWRGARAWWYSDRDPPEDESAGSSLLS